MGKPTLVAKLLESPDGGLYWYDRRDKVMYCLGPDRPSIGPLATDALLLLHRETETWPDDRVKVGDGSTVGPGFRKCAELYDNGSVCMYLRNMGESAARYCSAHPVLQMMREEGIEKPLFSTEGEA